MPCPGMDPYIEQSKLWVDFYSDLASEIHAKLNTRIRPIYFARLPRHITGEAVEVSQSRVHDIRSDVGVMQRRDPQRQPLGAVTPDEPLELLSVEIRRSDSELLVTAIEILSPVNKQPSHQAYTDYLRKLNHIQRKH